MSTFSDSPSSNSTTIISSNTHNDSGDMFAATSVKNYVKDLLKSRIFLGRYIERRLVDQHIGYRDIVVLSAAEGELKRDLIDAKEKMQFVFPRSLWIGITDSELLNYSPPSLCLWIEIDNQPFGLFWFQVKTVQFRDNEVIIKLKCLRLITDAFLEAEPILTGDTKPRKTERKIEQSKEALSETFSDIKENLSSALSISNIKELITFFCALILAVFTGSSSFITFLGNFTLALVRETSVFIKNSTPLLLGFLDFLSKIVGGFYILLAMFFKPSKPLPSDKRRITYNGPPLSYANNFDSRDID